MVEKIRISLWDIFTFFTTGFYAIALAVVVWLINSPTSVESTVVVVSKLPSVLLLVACIVLPTMIGLIVEPIANYSDSIFFNRIFLPFRRPKTKHSKEEELLKTEIVAYHLGPLSGRIEDPFLLCKEYVETKQLSTTFMVFLSRYGFYRNCVFLTFTAGALFTIQASSCTDSILIFTMSVVLCAVFKVRAEDFYSYMAPSIYRAFAIDRIIPPQKVAGSAPEQSASP